MHKNLRINGANNMLLIHNNSKQTSIIRQKWMTEERIYNDQRNNCCTVSTDKKFTVNTYSENE